MRGEIAKFDDSRTDIATLANAVATLIPRPLSAMAALTAAGASKSEERFYCGKVSGYVTVREGGSTRVLEPPHGLEPRPFTWRHNESGAEQLAIALLRNALGDEETARRFYQRFSRRVIANFPDTWTITRTRIIAHINMMKHQNN